jgi:hypothetical protein
MTTYRGLPDSQLQQLSPEHLRQYVESSGWKLQADDHDRVAVYMHPSNELVQLLIPLDTGFEDYTRRMADAMHSLAEAEAVDPYDILIACLAWAARSVVPAGVGGSLGEGNGRREQAEALADGPAEYRVGGSRVEDDSVQSLLQPSTDRSTNVDTFSILSWNVGGSKYLEALSTAPDRHAVKAVSKTYERVAANLGGLLSKFRPDIVTLQEIVRPNAGESSNGVIEDLGIVDILRKVPIISGYKSEFFPVLSSRCDLIRPSFHALRRSLLDRIDFEQGYAVLYKNEAAVLSPHPIWDEVAPADVRAFAPIHLSGGLYFGNRDTEPRLAVMGRFRRLLSRGKVLDVCVLNVHLPTLHGERENLPSIDLRARTARLRSIEVVLDSIITPYNEHIRKKGEERRQGRKEGIRQKTPLWCITGDLNCMPDSDELQLLRKVGFVDLHAELPERGTKIDRTREDPQITFDYVLVGPKYTLLGGRGYDTKGKRNLIVREDGWQTNRDGVGCFPYELFPSDHLPLFGEIGLRPDALDDA